MHGKPPSVQASVENCLQTLRESNKAAENICASIKAENMNLAKALLQVQATLPEGYQSVSKLSKHEDAVEKLWMSINQSRKTTKDMQGELDDSQRKILTATSGLLNALQKQYRQE